MSDAIDFTRSSIVFVTQASYNQDMELSCVQETDTPNIQSLIENMLIIFLEGYIEAIELTMDPGDRLKELNRLRKELPVIINIPEYNNAINNSLKELKK